MLNKVPEPNGTLNGWGRLIGFVGIPGAISLYLVWWLTQWVGAKLASLEALLAEAGVADGAGYAADAEALRGHIAEIMDTISRLLERVWRGELAKPPDEPAPGGEEAGARIGWL